MNRAGSRKNRGWDNIWDPENEQEWDGDDRPYNTQLHVAHFHQWKRAKQTNPSQFLRIRNKWNTSPLLGLLMYTHDMALILVFVPSYLLYIATTTPVFPVKEREERDNIRDHNPHLIFINKICNWCFRVKTVSWLIPRERVKLGSVNFTPSHRKQALAKESNISS